jgi:metal-responsive CopG/Arc/MetJ family transcriptional regulator
MTQLLSVRLDEALLAAVDAAGRSEGRARSELVREALELWLRERQTAEKVAQHRSGYSRHAVRDAEFGAVLGAQRWPK